MPMILNYKVTPRAFAMRCTPEELRELKAILQEPGFQVRIKELPNMDEVEPDKSYRFEARISDEA